MLMGDIRASIRALASTGMDAAQILTAAHHILRERTSVKTFITVFFLHLDPAARTIRYIGAGHEAYYLRRGVELEVLQSTTVPLGVIEQIDFRNSKAIELAAGDILVLVTDGVTETQNSDQALFGVARSLDVVRAHATRPAGEIVDALCDAAREFCIDQRQLDDVTAVIVKVLP
jgi:sigma-B regulation protein RsbU (phosphoserine phosphatase)